MPLALPRWGMYSVRFPPRPRDCQRRPGPSPSHGIFLLAIPIVLHRVSIMLPLATLLHTPAVVWRR